MAFILSRHRHTPGPALFAKVLARSADGLSSSIVYVQDRAEATAFDDGDALLERLSPSSPFASGPVDFSRHEAAPL